MPKATKLFALTVTLLVLIVVEGRAQSALDGFDPNANGAIRAVVVQPDGKILIGGDFTTLSPNGGGAVTRNRIARLNPDGTLDLAFDPNANGSTVNSIAVQADGKILAGGFFTSIGGQIRNNIARLDATTGLADSFNPNASDTVNSIAVQADGKVLAGGFFNGVNCIGGQTRNFIARLDATTGLADSLNLNANNAVLSIAVQADGKILAGGGFTSIGGQTRNRIARLDATTGAADSFNPNANSAVFSIAVQADGKVLAGGFFNGVNSIGGQTRNRIARLDATTGLADSFNPNANNAVGSIVVQADGQILAGGDFSGANSIGGQARNHIARLNATTGLADSFNPNASNAGVYAIAVQVDGKVLVGGDFTTLSPNGGTAVTRNHIARLETDGRLDRTLDLNMAGTAVYATAVQPDGKILIGGAFNTILDVNRKSIARLNTDGTLDTAFSSSTVETHGDVYSISVQTDRKIVVAGSFQFIGGSAHKHLARLDVTGVANDSFIPDPDFRVYTISLQANGRVLAGGIFDHIGGQDRNYIARLDATTGAADSFNPIMGAAEVYSTAVQADGRVLVGGLFNGANSIGGQTRNYIARLDPTTGLADSFDPNANGIVRSIAVQAGGKVLVGGDFTTIGGQTRNHIARLDPVTGLADSFDPNPGQLASVYSIVVQADGKILVGGGFTTIGGQTRSCIARLYSTTGLADSFDPNANDLVYSIAVQGDGKILAGGDFNGANSIGGQTRSRFARLNNDTIALQSLAVTQTMVTWTRGGSSPLLRRVTFEYSTDNVNYNFLGDGMAAGSNWVLTGLNLSTGQNLYIRARGHYQGGADNGSESITEFVRNAFVAVPTPTPTPINISGVVSYCSNPVPGPAPNVTMTRTGTSAGVTVTDAAGSYSFAGLASGGTYTVTPTKPALTPGVDGIDGADVVAVIRHFLEFPPLIPAGCQLDAADADTQAVGISGADIVAIQRFYLGLPNSPTSRAGQYRFTPTNRSYPGVESNQTGQNYDALIYGDVADSFVHRPEGGPSQR